MTQIRSKVGETDLITPLFIKMGFSQSQQTPQDTEWVPGSASYFTQGLDWLLTG